MREPLWDRIKQRWCQWFGHRETWSMNSRSVWCCRCRYLLRGPKNLTRRDRVRYLGEGS